MERKLKAILSADVVGYSRLVEDDDEATVALLLERRDLISRRVADHHGRVVDAPGDNLLAAFSSAVEAVRCALGLQKELDHRNRALPAEQSMYFRIGIDVGDVVEQGAAFFGDAVNVAARMERLATAGGICVTGRVFDQITRALSEKFDFVGHHSVKNISHPIAVWRAQDDVNDGVRLVIGTPRLAAVSGWWQRFCRRPASRLGGRLLVAALVVLLLVLIARTGERADHPESDPVHLPTAYWV